MSTSPPHVVLGGNGIVGRETVRALIRRGTAVASVGRRPALEPGSTSLIADLLAADQVADSLRGAEVAYLTPGVPYSAKTWAAQWPVIMRNAIDAALAHDVHLVFLDNVYAYGAVDGPMTEQTPLRPAGAKGRVRADLARMLEAARDRGLRVTIARSADFFGPGATTSVFNSFALDRIAAGRAGTWLFDPDQPHSMTYTPDLAEALAILGAHPAAGVVWHLPTAAALTGREYLAIADPGGRCGVMGDATMRIGALFNRAARETLEMRYQYIAPYLFDSTAFEARFGMSPTPTEEAIATTLAAAR